MATGTAGGLLGHLRWIAADPARPDGELLDRFRADRDEAAFAALVRRHGPMVLGVCRRTLRNEADAEDAFQAVFLVLARRAHAVQPAGRVGPWLYGVACNTARKARLMNRRRVVRERRAGEARLPDHRPVQRPDGLDHLDHELGRLPDRYRTPVVLCDLEGETLQAAARRLGCPVGTVASRLARGRALLRKHLGRCGLAAGAAAFLPAGARAAVPARLAMLTARAATGAGPVPAHVLTLTDGVIRAMFLSKMKFALAAVVAAGVLVGGVGARSAVVGADQDKPKPTDPPAVKPEKPVKPDAEKPTKPGAEKPVKPEGEKPTKPVKPDGGENKKAPTVQGTLKSLDADKGSITITVSTKGAATADQTYPLAKDAKVMIEGAEGKLADLKPGNPVTVKLSAEGKEAVGIGAEGPMLTGTVKAIDAAKHTLQLTVVTRDPTDKTKNTTEEKALKLAENVKVSVKGAKTASLTDVKAGDEVTVRLSLSGDRAVAVWPHVKVGPMVTGELKEVAADKKSVKVAITVFGVKGDKTSAKTEEQTILLAGDVVVAVPGKKPAALEDLKVGTPVNVQMSADGKQAVAIWTPGPDGEKKPTKPGADPVKPVKPGTEPVKPVKPGTDPVKPEKPVKPGADPVKPGADKPGAEKPGGDKKPEKPAPDQAEKPVKPGADPVKPGAEKPGGEKKPEKPAAEKPGADKKPEKPAKGDGGK